MFPCLGVPAHSGKCGLRTDSTQSCVRQESFYTQAFSPHRRLQNIDVPNHNRWENIIHKPRLSQLQESGDPVHCYVCKAISRGMIHDVVCIVVCGQFGCVLLLGSGGLGSTALRLACGRPMEADIGTTDVRGRGQGSTACGNPAKRLRVPRMGMRFWFDANETHCAHVSTFGCPMLHAE